MSEKKTLICYYVHGFRKEKTGKEELATLPLNLKTAQIMENK